MKTLLKTLATVGLIIMLAACQSAGEKGKTAKKELTTQSEKISYAIGQDFGKAIKKLPVEIDTPSLLMALEDAFSGAPSRLSDEEVEDIKKEIIGKVQEQQIKEYTDLLQKNQAAAKEFLAANKAKEGVITTASGLQYIVLKQGSGPSPKKSDRVKVHYMGQLLDGTEFDSSYKRKEPYLTEVTGVIPGWTEALQLMKVNGKYRLFIPPELGYGEMGNPPVIQPNVALIFEVELLAIEK